MTARGLAAKVAAALRRSAEPASPFGWRAACVPSACVGRSVAWTAPEELVALSGTRGRVVAEHRLGAEPTPA